NLSLDANVQLRFARHERNAAPGRRVDPRWWLGMVVKAVVGRHTPDEPHVRSAEHHRVYELSGGGADPLDMRDRRVDRRERPADLLLRRPPAGAADVCGGEPVATIVAEPHEADVFGHLTGYCVECRGVRND